jgi:hypothetical protein
VRRLSAESRRIRSKQRPNPAAATTLHALDPVSRIKVEG